MKIINTEHSIASENIVSTLKYCSLPVSPFEHDHNAFLIRFYGHNFKKLMDVCNCHKKGVELIEARDKDNIRKEYEKALREFSEQVEKDNLEDLFAELDFIFGDDLKTKSEMIEEAQNVIKSLKKEDIVNKEYIQKLFSLFKEKVVKVPETTKTVDKNTVDFDIDYDEIVVGTHFKINGEELQDLKEKIREHLDYYYKPVMDSYDVSNIRAQKIERLLELSQNKVLTNAALSNKDFDYLLAEFCTILGYDFDMIC